MQETRGMRRAFSKDDLLSLSSKIVVRLEGSDNVSLNLMQIQIIWKTSKANCWGSICMRCKGLLREKEERRGQVLPIWSNSNIICFFACQVLHFTLERLNLGTANDRSIYHSRTPTRAAELQGL